MRIKLQLSVALAFAALTLVVLAVTVGFFYLSNRALAIETGRGAMVQVQARSDAALHAHVTPVLRLVATTAHLAGHFHDEIGARRGFDTLAAEFAGLDDVYSVFIAEDASNRFVQAARISPMMTTFGPDKVPVPEGAVRLYSTISGAGDARTDRITFLAADGSVLSEVTAHSTFLPRARPWHAAALVDAAAVVSPIYTFASTGRPGLTFSNRYADPDGVVRGVVGVDLSIDSLSGLLQTIRVDGLGEVFLLDAEGRLIATSESAGASAPHPLTDAAMARWDGSDGAFFRVGGTGRSGVQLVSMARITPILGTSPFLGVVVPQRHFIAGIEATTRRVLAISGLVALAAMAATVLLSRLLSKPLQLLSEEARRISTFDLSGQFRIESRITEVAELGAAMANMKNSLNSFGAYVPKDVVRSLVASGGTAAVGGTARDVTLLFSDIENFTRKSEALPPEVTMRDLSRYFEAMSGAVAAEGGTVDKYIGDAVMAIWNAPGEVERHAAAACRGALACHAAEAALNRGGAGALVPTHTRIGLHSDRVVVGNVGSASRLQYTAIGEAVNLASRVEGLNKVYGTSILATQAVVDGAGDGFVFREVDLVSPAGTTRPVALHELLGEAGKVDAHLMQDVAAWAEALFAYRRRDWQGAAAGFAALRDGPAGKTLVSLYLGRCAAFAKAPPPDDWDGVAVMDRK